MRPVRALVICLVIVFVGGALLAPWLYWLTQSFAGIFPRIAGNPFHRFVNRSLLGLALLGLWPLLHALGATHWRDVGLVKPAGEWKKLATGFALGFASLAILALAALATGARALRENQTHAVQNLLSAAVAAAAVAPLEEILFRGALFGALRRAFNWIVALLLSSAAYALVHFMESARLTGPVQWYSGLQLLPQMLRGMGNWHTLMPGFLNLALAGALLGLAYQRTGNLWFSIGLHAGWIFWLKWYGAMTRDVAGANTPIWGGGKLIDGWLALSVLVSMLLLFLRRPFPPSAVAPPDAAKAPT